MRTPSLWTWALSSWTVIGLLAMPGLARAGRGGSTQAIKAAITSGSTDAIVAELERAEHLVCIGCIAAVRPLVDHPSAKVRDAAGWWLGRRGARKEISAAMIARLSAEDPIAARNAAEVLGALRDFSSLPALSAYMGRPLDEESGRAAARAIGAIGHPTGLVALEAGMRASLPGVRAGAVAAVRELRAPKGAKVVSDGSSLLPLLIDADEAVRREAVLSLGHLGARIAVDALGKLATSDASAQVRKAAAWALGELGDGAGRTALQQAAEDADPLVRSIALAAERRLR